MERFERDRKLGRRVTSMEENTSAQSSQVDSESETEKKRRRQFSPSDQSNVKSRRVTDAGDEEEVEYGDDPLENLGQALKKLERR